VGGAVHVTARVENRQGGVAPMVMLDLPIPPGFAADGDEFANLVNQGSIARYQVLPRSVLVYLRDLSAMKPLVLAYTLRATMPVKVAAPAAHVYEYYDPQKQGRSQAQKFVVK
jgi:uncharacterized protein YfaS (alpha-2-macroglobulin family)